MTVKPILPKELALVAYRNMARNRALTEVLILNRPDIFGAFLSSLGMEAIAAGVSLALLEQGILFDSRKSGDHRTTWGLACALDEITAAGTVPAKDRHNHAFEITKNHLTKLTSYNRGRDGNIHWGCLRCHLLPFMCSDMGRQFPVMVGMAEEMARQQWWRELPALQRPVGVAMFGEGADQQGCVHEANSWIAASNCVRTEAELKPYEQWLDPLARELRVLRGAPVFEVVVVNQRSIYTDVADEHGRSDLAKRALGYGNMVGVDVDGDDVEAVYRAAKEAINRAQRFQATRIIAHTYRRTGHNEDQIIRNEKKKQEAFDALSRGEWDYEPDWSDAKIIDVDPEEFKTQWATEPLKQYRQRLTATGVATAEELSAITRAARQEMWELYSRAKAEPDVTPEENRKDYAVIPPFPKWSLPLEAPTKRSPSRRLYYQKAYIEALRELLRTDPRVTVFGQDVRTGGVLVPTRELAKEFGPNRLFNVGIVEEAIHSNAAGRALDGGRPVFEGQQFADFFGDAFASILTVVAANWYQKRMKFSYINVFHSGIVRSGGSGHYHEAWVEAYLQHMLGITIVAPADAHDLIGLFRAAHQFDGPVAMLLQISAAGDPEFASDVPEEPFMIPLGKAKVKREGKDVSVMVYGAACVAAALNEAEYLAKEGVSVEVIDLRTVWPCDWETLRSSIMKTGRALVMHEDWAEGGIGESIAARLIREPGSVLPYIRTKEIPIVASDNVPIPTAEVLVWDRLPYELEERYAQDEKGRALRRMIHRSRKLAAVIKQLMEY